MPEKGPGAERGDTADGCPGQCENGKAAAEMAAQMVDREKAEGQDTALVRCREDGADGARDDADENVGGAHKHIDSFVER